MDAHAVQFLNKPRRCSFLKAISALAGVNSGADLELKIGFENLAMVVWPNSIMRVSLEGSGAESRRQSS
jgi:hypothetical protein